MDTEWGMDSMIIMIKQVDPIVIQLSFTEEEAQHPLFSSTLNEMYQNTDYDISGNDENVNVEIQQDLYYDITGQTVDDIRELWCGDVVFEYDGEGNPLPKDLSNCPCFKIGE